MKIHIANNVRSHTYLIEASTTSEDCLWIVLMVMFLKTFEGVRLSEGKNEKFEKMCACAEESTFANKIALKI